MTEVTILIESEGGRCDWGPGDLLAYSSIKNLASESGGTLSSEIWSMQSDGSEKTDLTSAAIAIPHLSNDQPAWHPSGEHLLFQCADPDLAAPPGMSDSEYQHMVQGGFGYHNNLWLMTSDGTMYWPLTSVTSGEGTLHAHFSPDGTKIFWSANDPTRSGGQGWVLKLADFSFDRGRRPTLRNIRTFTPLGADGTQVYEAHMVSPDNRTLLYSYSPGQPLDMDIWQTNIRTNQSTNLTQQPGVWDEHAHWSPSGDTIAWISSYGYDFVPSENWQKTLRTDVWLMDPDGSNKRQLTTFNDEGYAICADLAWSKDGQHLVLCRTEFTRRYGSRQQVLRIDL